MGSIHRAENATSKAKAVMRITCSPLMSMDGSGLEQETPEFHLLTKRQRTPIGAQLDRVVFLNLTTLKVLRKAPLRPDPTLFVRIRTNSSLWYNNKITSTSLTQSRKATK